MWKWLQLWMCYSVQTVVVFITPGHYYYYLIFTLFCSSCVFLFVSSSFFCLVPIHQVSVGTRQTWNVGTKHMARTSSPRRRPRLSWSLCGRPYRTSHSSSWRPLPSSLSASLCTNLQERKVNVRAGTLSSILDKEQSRSMEKNMVVGREAQMTFRRLKISSSQWGPKKWEEDKTGY